MTTSAQNPPRSSTRTLADVGFNLADDPWIPFPSRSEISLREVFADADSLPGWPSGDPLFASAVLRLLAALTYRIARISDSDSLQTARTRGVLFDADTVNAYFDTHRDEFWLLPPPNSNHQPFYQDPRLAASKTMPIARSRLAMSVVPSYVWGQQHPDPEFTPAAAARCLLVFLLYGPGGSGGAHPDLPDTKWQDGRLRGKVSIHPTGATLHGTLKLHLIDPDDTADTIPGGIGVPAWETPPTAATRPLASPDTIMEQITGRWEKTALLINDSDPLVGRAVTASGRRRSVGILEHDPYTVRWDTPRTNIEKAAAKGKQLPPYTFLKGDKRRAPWRDIDNYLAQRPSNATTIIRAVNNLDPGTADVEAWVAVSHQPDNAKDVMWAVSAIPPEALLDADAGHRAAAFIKDAETIDGKLAAALRRFHNDAGTDWGGTAKSIRMAAYWSRMESLFPQAVSGPHDRTEIRAAARAVYNEAVAAVGDRMSAPRRATKTPSDMRLEPVAVTAARHRAGVNYPAHKPKKAPQR